MYRIIVIVLTTFLLSACMLGPDFKKPDYDSPQTFRFAEDAAEMAEAVNLKWWELFSDPDLVLLVQTALRHNLDVRSAVSRIEEARAALGFSEADLYPMLDIQGGAQIGNYIGRGRSDTTDTSAYIAPVLSWEIDFWGKYRRYNESGREDLLSSE